MISPETRAQIRRYFYAEHWKVGTIASELGVHPDAVRNAIEAERFKSAQPLRASLVDPYSEFIRLTLDQHPRLRATRIYQMIRDRGYRGSIGQLRRAVSGWRPLSREPFLKLQMFPGEQAQVDWAHFGHVMVGRAKRALSCFVMTLSYSRALYLEFFFDQTMEKHLPQRRTRWPLRAVSLGCGFAGRPPQAVSRGPPPQIAHLCQRRTPLH
jgi:transposase